MFKRHRRQRIPLAGYTSMIRRDPVGVVASIAPWNYPLMMTAWKLAPALAAGNTVVVKPSEQTPLTTLKLAESIAEIFPKGVVNVVAGRGESVGAPLVEHDGVRMVSLTGSIASGQKVLKAASRTIKRTHLELGGKAPVIVFDDADLEAVVAGIRTFGYYNAGQDCTWINTHFMLANKMPHGGVKKSGYGKYMSMYGLEDYTTVRHMMVKLD